MSSETARPAEAGTPRRHKARWLACGCALPILIVLALGAIGGWLLYTGVAAKSALSSAAGALSGAQSAILDGDVASARIAVQEASQQTAKAHKQTSDIVWRGVSAVPWLGSSPKAVMLSAEAADQVVSGALPQFVNAAQTLDVTTIKSADGTVDLARFAPAGAQLAAAEQSMIAARDTMTGVPTSGVPGFVSDGVGELNDKIDEALTASGVASKLLAVLPGMLGQSGTKTYFVAFQSPVEIRGTGGFLGTFGLMTVDNGKLVSKEVETNTLLKNFPAPVLDLGPDYTRLYGKDPAEWVNMNMSPNFPYAGAQWAQAWKDQAGQQVAGVMGVDITALKYLIQATGPVTAPDGKVLTADNVVAYLGNDVYLEKENSARKDYQAEVATELIDRVLHLEGGTGALIQALTTSVSGGHLQLWSADATAQQALAATPLAAQTPSLPGPYAQLVLNNGGGNKLDYYLARKVEYTGGKCSSDGTRKSTVKVTLTNTAPNEAIGLAGSQPGLVNRTITYTHLPIGGGYTAARLNGNPIQPSSGMELGHPVAVQSVDVPQGASVVLEYDVLEPQSDARPVVPAQPMVIPQETVVNWSGC